MGRKRRLARLNICSRAGRMAGMKATLTAKLKLLTTPDQLRALRATQLAYRDALPLCQRLLLCAPQDEQRQTSAKSDLCGPSLAVWFAFPDGLQCAPPGGSHLQ